MVLAAFFALALLYGYDGYFFEGYYGSGQKMTAAAGWCDGQVLEEPRRVGNQSTLKAEFYMHAVA